jgi:hypothetical protein
LAGTVTRLTVRAGFTRTSRIAAARFIVRARGLAILLSPAASAALDEEVPMYSTISCPQRRVDVWIGRFAAIAGIVYVTLVTLWPLQADAAPTAVARPMPRTPPSLDLRLAGALADVSGGRRDSSATRRVVAPIRTALIVSAERVA